MQKARVLPTRRVRVRRLGEQMVQQHLKLYLGVCWPAKRRSDTQHLELAPPAYPVTLMMPWSACRLLSAQLGSVQMKLMQNFTQRQLESESLRQQPSAVRSQSGLIQSLTVQYSLDEQLLGDSIAQPFRNPKLMNLPRFLNTRRYHPVSSSNANVMQDMVGLLTLTPAVINSFNAVFLDQCESAVPVPPLVSKAMPGGSTHPYCRITSRRMQDPFRYMLPLMLTKMREFWKLGYRVWLKPSTWMIQWMPMWMFYWKLTGLKDMYRLFQCTKPHRGRLVVAEAAQGKEQAVTPLSPSSQASTSSPKSLLGTVPRISRCGTVKLRH